MTALFDRDARRLLSENRRLEDENANLKERFAYASGDRLPPRAAPGGD
jgi:hypothetical protein